MLRIAKRLAIPQALGQFFHAVIKPLWTRIPIICFPNWGNDRHGQGYKRFRWRELTCRGRSYIKTQLVSTAHRFTFGTASDDRFSNQGGGGILEVQKLYAVHFRSQLAGVNHIPAAELGREFAQLEQVFAEVLVPRAAAFDFDRDQPIMAGAEDQVDLQSLRVPQEIEFRHLARVQTALQRLGDHHVLEQASEERGAGDLLRR